MQKEFIPYEEAKTLKDLGFNEPCFGYYLAGVIKLKEYKGSQNKNSAFYNNTVCSAPTYSQVFRWFRGKGYRFNIVNDSSDINGNYYYDAWVNGQFLIETDYIYITYEEAEQDCLNKLIEIIKSK